MEGRWVSERALLFRFDGPIADANARAVAAWRAVVAAALPAIDDVVAGARSVLVEVRRGAAPPGELTALVEHPAGAAPDPATHEIEVTYDGADLAATAAAHEMTPDQIADAHAGTEYTVAFVGFSPGFPYLLGMPPDLATPRLDTPRTRVPAGSVAIGGRYTGIYPRETPGGWRLIGTTHGIELFDPDRDPPSLLHPGDRVRFVPRAGVPAPARAPEDADGRTADARVLVPGALTTVQDLGRFGYGADGVAPSGAMDPFSFRAANLCVGNPGGAPGLEITMSGPTIRFERDAVIALTGSAFAAFLDDEPVPFWRARAIRAGQTLTIGWTQEGARCYLGIGGGIDATLVLGSASRHIAAELGPEPLASGSALTVGTATSGGRAAIPARLIPYASERTVRVLPGAQSEAFDDRARAAFTTQEFRVTPSSNRTGIRLEGPAIRASVREIDPDPIPPGGVQITPDGRAIVLGPDRPVTGGYPKIATVVEADLALLAHSKPGDTVRFGFVTLDEARAAYEERMRALHEGIVHV